MAGFILLAAGAVALWCAYWLGPRYQTRRSAFLRTVGTREAVKRAPSLPPSQSSAALSSRFHPRPGLLLALYAAAGTALPDLLQGELPLLGPSLAGLAAGLGLPVAWGAVVRERRRRAMDRAAGDLVGHLRLQSAAGAALLPALSTAPAVVPAPLAPELEHLLADAQVAPLPSALQRLAERCQSPRIDRLVHHLVHQQSLGVPLEQILRDEEQHELALAREEVRQRIRSATLTMALVTFVLFMNGALLFATPLAIRAFSFLSQ